MTNHANRSLPSLPVLDDNTSDAMVLGFARTQAGAERIGRKRAAAVGMTFVTVEPATSVRVMSIHQAIGTLIAAGHTVARVAHHPGSFVVDGTLCKSRDVFAMAWATLNAELRPRR